MSAILSQAQALVEQLQKLMPSSYQQDSLQALLGLFLNGQEFPLPEHCQTKSASAKKPIPQRIQVVNAAGN
jgi:hypothetical protein